MFHILNHATFKAALFMSAGIVDHETGTRDIRKLGGLRHVMPITATLAMIAAASMAGVPLFNGFLSKEMMLEEAAHTVYAGQAWLFPVFATIGASAVRGLFGAADLPCLLRSRAATISRNTRTIRPFGMWLPVAVLIVPVIAIGLMPAFFAGAIVERTALAAAGGALPDYYLALWHGLTPALAMSVTALAGGLAALWLYLPLNRLRLAVPRPDAMTMFQAIIAGLVVCRAPDHRRRSIMADLTRYLGVIMVADLRVRAGRILRRRASHRATAPTLPVTLPALTGWLVLLAGLRADRPRHHDRLFALIVTSVVGLSSRSPFCNSRRRISR